MAFQVAQGPASDMTRAVIGALRIVLGLDSANFEKGLRGAQRTLGRFGRDMQNAGTNLSRNLSLPLAGFAADTVRVAGDFEASMNRVQAALNTTGEEFDGLRGLARDMGAETQFSAIQAADAIETLAKNGLSAEEILGGALTASLNLAASTGADLATSADIATDVMQSFGKTAGELPGLVDGITGSILESKFNVNDYRLALGQAGATAGSVGVDFEDFNAVFAATASAFTRGSDAGTSFKTFLQSLPGKSGPARDAIEELGLEFFNADGSMRSMAEVAEELNRALSGLSDEERVSAVQQIFGTDAMRGALSLMRQGADGVREVSMAIDQISAQDQAEARMRGFNGAMKELGSAVRELQLAIADSGLLEAVTSFVQGLTDVIRRVGDADPALVKLGVAIGGIALVLGPLIAAGGALALFVAGIGAISLPVAAVISGIGLLTGLIIKFRKQIAQTTQVIMDFVGGALGPLKEGVQAVAGAITGSTESIGNAIQKLNTGVSTAAANGFGINPGVIAANAGVKAVEESFAWLYDRVIGNSWVPDLVDGVRDYFARMRADMPKQAADAVDETDKQFRRLGEALEEIGSTVNFSLQNMFDGLITGSFSAREALSQLTRELANLAFRGFLSAALGPVGLGIPGFAAGTSYAPGGLAMVGERGPELVSLPRGSQVVPSHELSDMGGGVRDHYIVVDTDKLLNTPRGRASVTNVVRLEGI